MTLPRITPAPWPVAPSPSFASWSPPPVPKPKAPVKGTVLPKAGRA